MKIIPYVELNGCRTFPDSAIIDIYKRFKEEGNIEKIFYNFKMRNEFDFLAFMKNPANNVFIATENDKPFLVAWFNEVLGRRATISFCSINGVFARKKIDAGREILKVIMSFMDVLIAIIPESYDSVRKFTEFLGFKEIGLIPYFSINGGAYIQYVTKDFWRGYE